MKIVTRSGIERLWSHISIRLNNKVDKINGKGLSSNDYTNEEKTKLGNIENGATNTTIDASLVTAGAAADAKATGEKIAEEVDAMAEEIRTTDLADISNEQIDAMFGETLYSGEEEVL